MSTHNIMRVISASVRGLWSIHGPDGIFVFRQDSSLPRGLLFQLLLIEHSGVGLSLASRFSLALGHTLVCKTRFVFCLVCSKLFVSFIHFHIEYSLQSMLISQSGSRKDVDIVPVCEKVKLLFSGLVHCVLIVVLLNLFIYLFYTKEFLELEYNLSSNSKNSPKKSLLQLMHGSVARRCYHGNKNTSVSPPSAIKNRPAMQTHLRAACENKV